MATVAGSAITVSTTTVRAAWRVTGRVETTAAEEVRGTVWSVPRGTPEVGTTREQNAKVSLRRKLLVSEVLPKFFSFLTFLSLSYMGCIIHCLNLISSLFFLSLHPLPFFSLLHLYIPFLSASIYYRCE